MAQVSFCSCLQHPEFLLLAVCFDTMVENPITILFHHRIDKIKAAYDEEISLKIKGFVSLCGIAVFLLKSLV